MLDVMGRELKVGDVIIYGTKTRSSSLHMAIITSIVTNERKWNGSIRYAHKFTKQIYTKGKPTFAKRTMDHDPTRLCLIPDHELDKLWTKFTIKIRKELGLI